MVGLLMGSAKVDWTLLALVVEALELEPEELPLGCIQDHIYGFKEKGLGLSSPLLLEIQMGDLKKKKKEVDKET